MKTIAMALLMAAMAVLTAPSSAWAENDKILVCHAAGKGKGGIAKLIPLPALAGHLKHNDCRFQGGNQQPGVACDAFDPDGNGICGIACDPATHFCPVNACGDGAGVGGFDIPCSCGDTVVT